MAIPAAIDPCIWLNMVTVKPPHLADLEIEYEKIIPDHNWYSQKCPSEIATENAAIYAG